MGFPLIKRLVQDKFFGKRCIVTLLTLKTFHEKADQDWGGPKQYRET